VGRQWNFIGWQMANTIGLVVNVGKPKPPQIGSDEKPPQIGSDEMKTTYELNINEIGAMIEKEMGLKNVRINRVSVAQPNHSYNPFIFKLGVSGVLTIAFEGEKE
jgi:hypothetical protein